MTPQERLTAFKVAVQAASDQFGVLLTVTSDIATPGGVIVLNEPTLGYLLLPEAAPELSEDVRAALEAAREELKQSVTFGGGKYAEPVKD